MALRHFLGVWKGFKLKQGEPTMLLGRWARKTVAEQLRADVHDPGYDQMHWSVFPPGPERQKAIKRHYENLERGKNC